MDVEELYDRKHLSFNAHLITHLPQSVLKWGPLWTHSAFCYENFHQFFKKLVKRSNSANFQILDAFRSQMALHKLQDLYEDDLTYRQRELLQELTNKQKIPQISISVHGVGLLGKSVLATDLCVEHFLASQRINVTIDRDSGIEYYKRAILDKEIIHSEQYAKVSKRNSYTVLLNNDEIFEIETFLVVNVQEQTKCFAVGHYLIKRRNN